MPKPAKRLPVRYAAKDHEIFGQIKHVTADHHEAVDNSIEDTRLDDGTVIAHPENYRPDGKFGAPKHIGMRRHVHIPEDARWGHELDEETG